MAVRLVCRFMVYHMVFYYRGGMVATVVVYFVVVAVAGTQGYEAYNGKADFDELVHFLGSFYC